MQTTNRWGIALAGVFMQVALGAVYAWSVFRDPLINQFHWTISEVTLTFTIAIFVLGFASFFGGLWLNKRGPRIVAITGGVLYGLGVFLASFSANKLWWLYLSYGVIGGVGLGFGYIVPVAVLVKWFPDKRGFATGMAAAGYGMGAVLTTFPISNSVAAIGYQQTLLRFGVLFGAVALLSAQGMRRAPAKWMSQDLDPRRSSTGVGPSMMLRSPIFWLMFLMFTLMSTSGLMVISQMGAFAKDFGITTVLVFGMAALPLALTLDRFTNGLTRPFFGWVSDRIGRENTMLLAFGFEGVAMTLWLLNRDNAVLFVLLSGVAFFGWGEIFSLFPSTLTDTFGKTHATTNYGFLYMAQGIGSILGGPLAAWMHERTGSWSTVFVAVIVLDFTAAILAIAVLKPMRARLPAWSVQA